ncbi:MAG: hypothetical protein J6A59_06520 [Lachnospiraceae bacterium]|nr:hypothetical protein [Lachnospiraceae bacterium]
MVYKVRYTSHRKINFRRHMRQFIAAQNYFNLVSAYSKNPKRIISIKIISSSEIEIVFYSKNRLSPGREANALWLFSHELAENHGFDIYLTSSGKLFKSAA